MMMAAALVGALLTAPTGTPAAPPRLELDVPMVRAGAEHCGQAAYAMVLRYYRADSAGLREADRAYEPALRGSLNRVTPRTNQTLLSAS